MKILKEELAVIMSEVHEYSDYSDTGRDIYTKFLDKASDEAMEIAWDLRMPDGIETPKAFYKWAKEIWFLEDL